MVNPIGKFREYLPQYRANLRLALPVVLSQVGQVVVQLADNAMVGRLGALPLAAVSFGGAVFVIFMFWGTGLSLGLTPLVGEAYVRKEYRSAAAFFRHSLVLYTGVGILLFLLLVLLGAFMDRMGQEPEVVELARPYFYCLAWSIVPFMVYTVFKQFLEGIGNTRTGMAVVLASNVINIGLNWVLIYGKLGFPAMGATGAGLATLIARVCMPLFMVCYCIGNRTVRRYVRLCSAAGYAWRWMRRLLVVGLPISMQMVTEVSAFALSSIMMGWIGATELAAYQIVITFGNLAFMMMVGVSTATTILVSHEYGAGRIGSMKRTVSASIHLGLAFNFLTMLAFIVFRSRIPLLFNDDTAVVAVAAQLFVLAGVYQFPDGLQVVLVGALRGMQDVRSVMRYAFVSYLLVNLPVGYLCAFPLGMGASGLWIGFIFGLSVAAVLYLRRYRMLVRRLGT